MPYPNSSGNNIDVFNIIECLNDSDSDDIVDFSNLSEKLEDINVKIESEKFKDDIKELTNQDQEVMKIVKNTTVSKLKKLKKEILVEYYNKLIKDFNESKKNLNKDEIIKCLKEKVITNEI